MIPRLREVIESAFEVRPIHDFSVTAREVDDLMEKVVEMQRELRLDISVVRTSKYAPPGSDLRSQLDKWYIEKEAKKTGQKKTSEASDEPDPFDDVDEVISYSLKLLKNQSG